MIVDAGTTTEHVCRFETAAIQEGTTVCDVCRWPVEDIGKPLFSTSMGIPEDDIDTED